jgi:hypothetical protein
VNDPWPSETVVVWPLKSVLQLVSPLIWARACSTAEEASSWASDQFCDCSIDLAADRLTETIARPIIVSTVATASTSR